MHTEPVSSLNGWPMKLLKPLLLLLLWITQSSQKIPVYIGGFFPLSPNKASVPGQALLAAAELALDHVNKSDVLQDYELNMIVKDSKVRSEAMLSRVQRRDCWHASSKFGSISVTRLWQKKVQASVVLIWTACNNNWRQCDDVNLMLTSLEAVPIKESLILTVLRDFVRWRQEIVTST